MHDYRCLMNPLRGQRMRKSWMVVVKSGDGWIWTVDSCYRHVRWVLACQELVIVV